MSYDRYESQRRRQTFGTTSRRTAFGYWVPLAITVTVATIGLAAWVWKERSDDDDEDYRGNGHRPADNDDKYREEYRQGGQPSSRDDPGLVSRMSGALRRTPSPQQFFDEAGRRVAASVAAAGAAVGGALGSIREENKGDYEDHTRWSEEAVARSSGNTGLGSSARLESSTAQVSQRRPGDRVKRVAVVVSADMDGNPSTGSEESSYLQEHASILSHLPEHVDGDTRVFVMIYVPSLQQHPLSTTSSSRPAPSIASSYSNIGQDDLVTPADEHEKPLLLNPQPIASSGSRMFNALYSQAQVLVDKDTMIMPFTTQAGYLSLLRHVDPSVVYIQATLSGHDGQSIKDLSRWVGQVVLVVGDETGHGGLVDSEDERGPSYENGGRWWTEDTSIGKGKGIEVVEGLRVGEDWRRRVKGHD